MKNKLKNIYNYIKDMDTNYYGYITIITILPLLTIKIIEVMGKLRRDNPQILVIKLSIITLGTLAYIILFAIWRHKMTRKEKISKLSGAITTMILYYVYI